MKKIGILSVAAMALLMSAACTPGPSEEKKAIDGVSAESDLQAHSSFERNRNVLRGRYGWAVQARRKARHARQWRRLLC